MGEQAELSGLAELNGPDLKRKQPKTSSKPKKSRPKKSKPRASQAKAKKR
jgi:hypothetical protein